jgi:hypothetical protein
MPYLTGRSPYPPPDPLVGRGSMALLSRAYPRGPIDLGQPRARTAADGHVPDASRDGAGFTRPGTRRDTCRSSATADRTLLSADALITTKQESMLAVLTQRCELHGPPAYYTQDWDSARESVRALAALEPELLVAGHGQPWGREAMRTRCASSPSTSTRWSAPLRPLRASSRRSPTKRRGHAAAGSAAAVLAGVGAMAGGRRGGWAAHAPVRRRRRERLPSWAAHDAPANGRRR